MYAQLCKRLSEEAPNFEPPGQPCTFKLLLLNKCRTEFENRAEAFAAFEEAALSPEEEEKRHLAKCKMLGNIKFIGELGKLEILAESILHRCIQNLLARRAAADHHEDLECLAQLVRTCGRVLDSDRGKNLLARRAAADHHEDLECLAQLVRTCGRVLDSERGKGLMEQYFARIETLSGARELAPRIRFMLRDVVELRRGGWVPRAATSAEGPVPIHQLRGDDEPRRDRDRLADRDSLFRGGLRARPLDDVLAGLGLQPPPALHPPADKLFGNGFGPRDAFRQRSAPGYFPRSGPAAAPPGGHHRAGGGGGGGKDARGRGRVYAAGAAALHDVQMRPAANSLMFTANRLSRPPPTHPPVQQNVLAPTFASAPPLLKEPAITIKPAPDKKDKPKKDKGVNKEEACRLGLEAVGEVSAEWREGEDAPLADYEPKSAALARLLQLQPPDKVLRRVVSCVLESALTAPDGTEAAHRRAWAAAAVAMRLKRAAIPDALKTLVTARSATAESGASETESAGEKEGAGEKETSEERDKSTLGLAALVCHVARLRLVGLGELAAWGAPPAALLHALQLLLPLQGADRLERLLHDSKINLCAYATELGGDGAEGALSVLEARGLDALVPQLRVQAQLARQLQADPHPQTLYRWIKNNVDPSVRSHGAFVSALVALVAGHVTAAAGAEAGADKAALEREKALVESYAPLLTALLHADPDLQLAAVYAVQVHAHHHRYPKGMLLRWFMYLYNLEVCEEDAFLRWREDVTDAYPGKGEALFQVNTWLTWLQQQESEDEEAED